MINVTVICSTDDCCWKLQSTGGIAFFIKFTLEGTVKAQKGRTLSLTLALDWAGGFNAMPRPLYPWERDPVPIGQEARWPHSVYYRDLFWLCAECYVSAANPFKTTFSVAFKDSVLTSQKMQYLSTTNTSWLMPFRKTVTLYSQTKHFVDTKCRICYCLSSFILAEFVNVWEFWFTWQLKVRLWSTRQCRTILSYNKTNEMHNFSNLFLE
jgi:Zn-finger protein